MATQGFVRRLRVAPPRMPGGEVNLQAPPDVPRVIPGKLLMKLMPFVMIVAVVGMLALMVTVGGRDLTRNPMFLMYPMMMVMAMVGMLTGGAGGRSGKAAAELNEERKDYFSYLAGLRDEADQTADEQRAVLEWSHPDPRALADLAGTRRMWERRPSDQDFCHVRVGIGTHRLATRFLAPETGPPEDLEPVSAVALRRFVKARSVVHALPTAVSLRAFPSVTFEGDGKLSRQLVRSMLLELCTFHGPDHIQVAVVTVNPDGQNWSWVKWLPHAQHPTLRDGMGPMRLLFPSLELLEQAFSDDLAERGRFSRTAEPTQGRRQLVVVIDDGYVSGDERLVTDVGLDSVTVLDLTGPPDGQGASRTLQLMVEPGNVGARTRAGVERFATPDQLGLAEAEATARRLSRYRLANAAHIVSMELDSRATDPGLMALLKIPDAAEVVAEEVWRQRSPRQRLRVPIGFTPNGQPLELDIKESAEGGMGPHGLCIGATGSGKSEFLRTLVLAMVTSHSPEALNLVLVDFKGGATFLGLEGVPHIAAIITNLEDELILVDRMRDALAGEINRRQELLRSAGFPNVLEYEGARANGAELDPLPALFIIVDEFSELLSQKPDFAELFVMIGRLGRSLHIHLLLASQRLEQGKLRGLDSHLSYRIGLKTFSAGESRSVLGVPDAYHLPSIPGSAFLKCDADEPVRFNTCYVSGEYVKPGVSQRNGRTSPSGSLATKLFTATPVKKDSPPPEQLAQADTPSAEPRPETRTRPTKTTLLDVVVSRLRDHGLPAHEVWLPPLDRSPAVNELLPDSSWSDPRNVNGRLLMPLGLVDRPYDQRRDLLLIDLSGALGNVAVVGGPQSGKSTTLRTMIVSGAATHTPEQIQFYCLDFGGGTLGSLASLPHVGGVAGRMDADRIRRTIAEVSGLLREREQRFRDLGIDSMRDFRLRKTQLAALPPEAAAQDPLSQDKFGDVVLVVDGWATIKSDFDYLEPMLQSLAIQGLSYGIHVAISATRWMEIRPAVKDMLGTRIELRMGDPIDSEVGRKFAELVPVGRPGRGMSAERLHMLVALPRLDSSSATDDLAAGVANSVEAVGAYYGERSAPQVRMLPHHVDRNTVVEAARQAGLLASQIAIGIDEAELAPVVLRFDTQPHLVVFGDSECGKTGLLRNIGQGIMDNATPTECKIILVDFQRSMLGMFDGDYIGGYATATQSCSDLMTALAESLKERLPPSDITPQQLKERSWWSGPEVYVLIDDYDLIGGGSLNHPLSPLVEYLPLARDIGLRTVITRRIGGAGRAMMDPIIGRLKDLSCNGLVMSGSKEEGGLFGGYKPTEMPPGRGMLVSRTVKSGVIQLSWDARPVTGIREVNHASAISGAPEHVRVSVVGGRTQLDVALPLDVPVASLVPELVKLVRSRDAEEPADTPWAAARDTFWVLSRLDPVVALQAEETLRAAGVVDGELLQLMDGRAPAAPTLYDDVVDAAARLNKAAYAGWNAAAARWMSFAGIGVASLIWVYFLVLGPKRAIIMGLAAVLVVAMVGGATLAHRSYGQPDVGAAVGWCAIPIGAALVWALVRGFADYGVAVGCAVLLVLNACCYWAIGVGRWGYLASGVFFAASGLAVLGCALGVCPQRMGVVLAVVATLACLTVSTLTDRLARVEPSTDKPGTVAEAAMCQTTPTPPPTGSGGTAPSSAAMPTAEAVWARVRAAAATGSALYAGLAGSVVCGVAVALPAGREIRWAELVFAGVCAAALGVHARVLGTVRERASLGVPAVVLVIVGCVSAQGGTTVMARVGLGTLLAVAAVTSAARLKAAGSNRTQRWAIAWAYLHYAAYAALIPVGLWVAGVYAQLGTR